MEQNSILAIDFDGTIVEHDYPGIGKLLPGAKETIIDLHKAGYIIIIWPCRGSMTLVDAILFCQDNEIPFHTINHNTKDHAWMGSRKVYADCYIDDRNIGGFIGWNKVRELLL